MARVCPGLSVRQSVSLLRQCTVHQKIVFRTLSSATAPTSSPPHRIHRHPLSSSSSSTEIPDLCLGAGGKKPGFVQQMLFSAPVDKNAKEQIDQSIRALLGDKVSSGSTATTPTNQTIPSSPFKFSH